MPQEISFENFKYTERDRYRKIRQGNNEVSFSYFVNYVVADMANRVLAIEVDDHFKKMCEKRDSYEKPDDWKHQYLPKTGEIVINPIGEQLIAFCEPDYQNLMKIPLAIFALHETLREKHIHEKSPPVVKNPTTNEELDIIHYENYEYLASTAEEVIHSNLYVSIFPPMIYSHSYRMSKTYFTYILALQHEYQKLLDFCFNTDFYAEELDGITAASRFHIYCGINDAVPDRTMNMSFRFIRRGFGNVSVPIRDKDTYDRFMRNPAKALSSIKEREPNAFEREYGIDTKVTELARIMPIPIASSFICRSLEEILYLEFEKMIELDMRIKKCKNCGRYFIFKGNYQAEYCDRVPEGETQNCQNISATVKYAQKVKDNPALAIFNRAYKRYHARMKVGSIKQDAFKKWKYEAVVMRDKCQNGELPVEEFENWIDADKRK